MKEKSAETPLPIPVGDRVLVELLVADKTAGGLVLPEKVAFTGIVRIIGQGVPEWFYKKLGNTNARGVKPGDEVHLARGANSGVEFDINGKKYLMVASNMVGAIVNADN